MGASAHEIVMESRQEIVDKLIAQMEKGYASTRAAWNSTFSSSMFSHS